MSSLLGTTRAQCVTANASGISPQPLPGSTTLSKLHSFNSPGKRIITLQRITLKIKSDNTRGCPIIIAAHIRSSNGSPQTHPSPRGWESQMIDNERVVSLTTVPTPNSRRNQASLELCELLRFCQAIVLWVLFKLSSQIMFSLNRANPISGTFVLTSCLPRRLNVPPLTGLFHCVPFISTCFSAPFDG